MIQAADSTPFYKKLAFNLFNLAMLGALLYIGQGILVPLFFAILLGTLLLPVTNFLQRRGLHKILSIVLSITVTLILVIGIVYMLSHQVQVFLRDMDAIRDRLATLIESFQSWINQKFNVSAEAQDKYFKDTVTNIRKSGPNLVGQTVLTIGEMLSYVVFLPVYTFLILYYKDLIRKFIIASFKNGSEERIKEILYESRTIGRHYILGLMIDMSIVFALNSIGFLVLGIKYAIFLALVAALLNLIPYIGMLVANVFCILITLVSSDNTSNVLWVAVVLATVQFIDNNFLMPLIVGNKVRINALVTIVGVVIGGALCGVSGMFLAIPGLAVMKVVFDRVEGLKSWGMLLGDDTSGKAKKEKPIV